MKTEKFRALCEQVLVPLLTTAFDRQLIDIHDVLDIASSELVRIGERLDDIETQLRGMDDEDA
ncbi:MAG TPA: hypothetical protein VGG10_02920 [Rhizomicrobium sp.]|jgi:hypothetical protein